MSATNISWDPRRPAHRSAPPGMLRQLISWITFALEMEGKVWPQQTQGPGDAKMLWQCLTFSSFRHKVFPSLPHLPSQTQTPLVSLHAEMPPFWQQQFGSVNFYPSFCCVTVPFTFLYLPSERIWTFMFSQHADEHSKLCGTDQVRG